jgi:hypothetical protein
MLGRGDVRWQVPFQNSPRLGPFHAGIGVLQRSAWSATLLVGAGVRVGRCIVEVAGEGTNGLRVMDMN